MFQKEETKQEWAQILIFIGAQQPRRLQEELIFGGCASGRAL